MFLERGEQRIGRVYKKAVYQQYTDATYRQEIEKPKWLGYLGPLISAEEDDVVIVHLKNTAKRAYSIHAHGLSYNKTNEGVNSFDHFNSCSQIAHYENCEYWISLQELYIPTHQKRWRKPMIQWPLGSRSPMFGPYRPPILLEKMKLTA